MIFRMARPIWNLESIASGVRRARNVQERRGEGSCNEQDLDTHAHHAVDDTEGKDERH